MKTLTAAELASNFRQVLDDLEESQEEVFIVRDHRTVARLVPEPAEQNALEMLGDVYRTLDDETADDLSEAVQRARQNGAVAELRDPWDP